MLLCSDCWGVSRPSISKSRIVVDMRGFESKQAGMGTYKGQYSVPPSEDNDVEPIV